MEWSKTQWYKNIVICMSRTPLIHSLNTIYWNFLCVCAPVCAGACMYLCVEARSWHWMFSSFACHLVLWDRISPWIWSSPCLLPVSYSLSSMPSIFILVQGSASDPHACNNKHFTAWASLQPLLVRTLKSADVEMVCVLLFNQSVTNHCSWEMHMPAGNNT